jgi:LPS O-antigen subunit length determinant protein (WzzB/FepE family)
MNNDATSRDEIDLIALLERALSFFNKNKWIFLVSCLCGLLLGFARYSMLPVVYKSRMIVQPVMLTNQNDIQMVAAWNNMLKSGDCESLQPVWNIASSDIEHLAQIKGEEIQKIFTPNNPNGFIISVYVTDPSSLPEIQKGIVYGINNSEYVKERISFKRARLQELIDKTSGEIKRLDSSKAAIEKIINGRGSSSSPLVVDGSSINRQIIEMNEKLLNFKEDLKFTNAVQVIQGFTPTRKPVGPNLILWLGLGLVSGFVIGYVIAVLRSVRKALAEKRQQS